ncbi:MAG: putative toxin-antitoxin system toxin component, PIN family [Defluviitaleaceae bacterium]|nr:putative toxin-antitoxin system toxin component, PIN family [Defluviitaleaceae bacterium]
MISHTSRRIKRVMLDTNILFSAMYTLNGKPFVAFSKASKMPYRLVLCDQIVDELRRNFNRKFPAKVPVIERFLSIAQYDLITITPEDEVMIDEQNIRDASDRPILRAARKADVDIFVTGDKDFLESTVINPKIMTAVQFIEKG